MGLSMRLDFSPFAGWIGDRKELPESNASRQLVRVMATGDVVGEAPTARADPVPPTDFGKVVDGFASDGTAAMPGTKARARLRRPLMLVLPIVVAALGVTFYLADERYVSTDDAFIRAAKITINARVAGQAVEIAVHDNDRVRQGQV